MLKRLFRYTLAIVLLLLALAVGAGVWLNTQLRGSLPQLDGELACQGLQHPVTITRDAHGVPTITAENRDDLAFATGFAHAQDRFFQMDLLRRNSAGELSALVGAAALPHDRQMRVHRFRHRAAEVLADGSEENRQLVTAYTAGVNAGLKSLGKPPFEYLLLRATPQPWEPEDCTLVLYSMFLDLQWSQFKDEVNEGTIVAALPPELAEFLIFRGGPWDAPIEGEAFPTPQIPGPEVLDLRATEAPAAEPVARVFTPAELEAFAVVRPGSNNWAVSGEHTTHGGPLVANDMHLGISVPNIWYRAELVWPASEPVITEEIEALTEPTAAESETPPAMNRLIGVTLPGTPALVVGSNGHIAWAFTNSNGDWVDVAVLEPVADDPLGYQTAEGPRSLTRVTETISVQGGEPETLEVLESEWGPVIDTDAQGRRRAARWVAHHTAGVNIGLLALETCHDLEESLLLAAACGAPAQNFTVGHRDGRIAWTILGRIPLRADYDSRYPFLSTEADRDWQGWLAPEDYPRVVDPPRGRIWTANSRIVDGEKLAKIGFGGYDLGARGGQIRDDLLALETASETDMLAVQLDDRAPFWTRWQELLLEKLTDEAIEQVPLRAEARQLVQDWDGTSAVDSVGYRLIRGFRLQTMGLVLEPLLAPCRELDPRFSIPHANEMETPVWLLVTEQPEHLLNPAFTSWDNLLLEALDRQTAEMTTDDTPLAEATWGAENTTRIAHPLTAAVPALGRWLNMPEEPLSGSSNNLPKIQRPSSGASERLVVSPGREGEGIFHMPGGQSGHPLSPYYADGHSAWTEGLPTPLVPGPAVHTLTLTPAE